MLRNFLAVLAGLVAAVVTISIFEGIGHALWPPPPDLDLSKPEDLARLMDVMPLTAKLNVLVAWGLGSFAGGAVAARLAASQPLRRALVVGGIQMAGGIATMVQIPHPAWMIAASLLLFVPGAALGARLAAQTGSGPSR